MIGLVEAGWQWRETHWLYVSVAVLLVAAVRYRQRSTCAFAVGHMWQRDGIALPLTLRQRLAALPDILEVVGMLAFVLALARPVLVEVEPPARLGRDVLLCFDRSSSMAVLDLDSTATRLAVGKQLAAEFVAGRVDDRLGIVTFARYADLVCPATADHAAVNELLNTVNLVDSEGPEDATAIGAAVGMAANLLQRSLAVGKVIVLLTDGEENVATAGAVDQITPLHAGQWCRDHGIRVYTIVLGKGEQQVDGTWRALDTTAVQQLAKISGGQFFPAANAEALRLVYAEIDRLETVQFREPSVRVVEWFALPTMIGLLLLFLAQLLRHSRMAVLP